MTTDSAQLLTCYNRACGQQFNPEKNDSDCCRHHPGVPVFHDALKGWSCCKKRTPDFQEFLNIPGCSYAQHTNVKPPEPEKPVDDSSKKIEEVIVGAPPPVRAPIKEPMARPDPDSALIPLKPNVTEQLISQLAAAYERIQSEGGDSNQDSSSSVEIAVGQACQRKGCSASYKDATSLTEQCVFHPGVPIFHEGMKYWSCCERKTTDFNAFLEQGGCSNSTHDFSTKPKVQQSDASRACRVDWFQTPAQVTISIFAKLSEPSRTRVEANGVRVYAHVPFDAGRQLFEKTFTLAGIIDHKKGTSVKMTPSKVEITMKKLELVSWSRLEL